MEPPPTQSPTGFRAFRRFNDSELRPIAGAHFRIDRRVLPYFTGNSIGDRIARGLAERRAFPFKELFESFEFFERVRKRMRAPCVADLCAGHGLTGMLFAVFEPSVQRVVLVDRSRPRNHDKVLSAVVEVAPWVEEKVEYWSADIKRALDLPDMTSIVAVHACGGRTDACLDVAVRTHSNVAVMPCCHAKSPYRGPETLRLKLGIDLATDIDRTYRLQSAGYAVTWTSVPEEITAKPRVIVGTRGGI